MPGYPDWQRPSPLLAERDAFYWPMVAGEKFAPVLVAAAYSQYRNRASLVIPDGAVSGNVTWPRLSRSSPASTTKTTLVLSFLFAEQQNGSGAGRQVLFAYGNAAWGAVARAVRLRRVEAGNWQFQTADGVAVETTVLGSAPGGAWQEVTFRIEDAEVECLIDDVVAARHATRRWPNVVADNPGLQPFIEVTGGALGDKFDHIAQLLATWE